MGIEEMPDGFRLDDVFADVPEKTRRRYTSKDIKRGESETVSFRCDYRIIGRMQKIIEQRLDADLETRSDILNDAIHLWLTTWDEEHPDGNSGRMSSEFRMLEIQRNLEYQDRFLTNATELMDSLKEHRDVRMIREFLFHLAEMRYKFGNAGDRFFEKFDSIVEDARRLVRDE